MGRHKKIETIRLEEENEVITLLERNMIEDLKKNELDKFERCKVLLHILKRNSWSVRKLAKMIDKPKSTVEDWLLFSKLSSAKYEELKDTGLTDTDIYRTLRDSKAKDNVEDMTFKSYTRARNIDMDLRECINMLSKYIAHGTMTKETKDLIIELEHVITSLKMRAETVGQ